MLLGNALSSFCFLYHAITLKHERQLMLKILCTEI